MNFFPKHIGECETDCPSGRNTEDCKGPWDSGPIGYKLFGGRVLICGDFNIKTIQEDIEVLPVEEEQHGQES